MRLNANISHSETEWERLCPLINEEAINGKAETAIFKLFSKGVTINRDNSMYDLSELNLERKIAHLIENDAKADQDYNTSNPDSENYSQTRLEKEFKKDNVLAAAFRPYCKLYIYYDEYLINETDQWIKTFKKGNNNVLISINSPTNLQDFFCLSADAICDEHFTGDSLCIHLNWYSNEEVRQDNITDWAFQLFNDYYRQNEPSSPVCYAGSAELRDEFRLDIPVSNPINKRDIFYYVYAVLHHPAYREKYRVNLKREFPRIPLYDNFQQWCAWGKSLMDLHVNYEAAQPYPLKRSDVVIEHKAGGSLDSLHNAKLEANKEEGVIEIDAVTSLSRIPKSAWDYRLGNRSALEWVLDQYKEKEPGDATIAEQCTTYRFNDYKEQVIDLLNRVCTVCTETMKIVGEMP